MPSITLRAKHPERNLDREYVILVQPGMFNTITVQIFYGRWQKNGTYRQYSFDNVEEAKKFIRIKLAKRYSSQNRIGCNYQAVKMKGSNEQLGLWFNYLT